MPTLLIALGLLIGLAWLWLLLRLAKTGKPDVDAGATFTLRHSAVLRVFSVLALFGGETLFALWAVIVPPRSVELAWAFTAGAALLGVAGFALLWESYRWRLVVSPSGLDCQSPWKPRRVAAWNDVAGVKYSSLNGWHVIRFTDGGSFRVPAVVPGVKQFLAVSDINLKRR